MQARQTSGQELAELQDQYNALAEKFASVQSECKQLRNDLEVERINSNSKNDAAEFYHSIVNNIQMQIESASRPGTGAEGAHVGNSQADVLGAVRQSIGVCFALAAAALQLYFPLREIVMGEACPYLAHVLFHSMRTAAFDSVGQHADAAGFLRAARAPPATPARAGHLSSHALRTAENTPGQTASPAHNEYLARGRGLGKPCLQMDMGNLDRVAETGSENSSPNNAKKTAWRRIPLPQ